jgi:excinuclease ABC subunit A
MDVGICSDCDGFRINEKARNAKINGKHIGELAQFTISELIDFLETITKKKFKVENSRALVNKIIEELKKFEILGLSYLHLNRYTRTLSGGEVQRLSLIAQMSLGLENVILILDEPTMGMHEIEKENLGKVLLNLRDSRNSVLIVEHDESLIKLAEQIIDLGPGAGVEGGNIVFQGTYSELLKDPNSLTGKYLSNQLKYPKKTSKDRRKIDKSKKIQ